MIAFEVVLNEKRLAVGGIGDDGVLTAIVTLSARSKILICFFSSAA